MTAPAPIEPHSVWRDRNVTGRRLRVSNVADGMVEALATFSTAGDAWDHAATVVHISERNWRRHCELEESA